MNKLTYKTYSRVAYKLDKNGKLNRKSKEIVYGGEIYANGKLVQVIPLLYKSRLDVTKRIKTIINKFI
jgi:hypothetical protein